MSTIDVTYIPADIWYKILLSPVQTAISSADHSHSPPHSSMRDHYPHELEAFTALLRTQPEDYTPRVDHLYLAFANQPSRSSLEHVHWYDIRGARAVARASQPGRLAWEARFHVAVTLPFKFSCAFPQLQELVWIGDISAFEAENLKDAGRDPGKLPALERVHCIYSEADKAIPALSFLQPLRWLASGCPT
ncbi:hypothetical protein GY45DRAFT_1337410 [Cubamyces sp. BRFM 1775]|nr:hypothetical protein GY45DRAFT_1337410 [Cubamyces sp. BRFM 1775]